MSDLSLNIISLDLEMDADRFFNELQEKVDEYNNDKDCDIEVNQNKASTRMGIDVMQYTFCNHNNNSNFEIITHRNGNNVHFEPFMLKSFGEKFFKGNDVSEDYQDASACFDQVFTEICLENKGTYATVNNGVPFLIRKGVIDRHIKMSIEDSKGNTYSINGVVNDVIEDPVSEDDDEVFIPKVVITEWLEEPEQMKLKAMISNMDRAAQFETIAGYLISKKRANAISSFAFSDLFRQAGEFADMFGGFKNPTIQQVYQFFSDPKIEEEEPSWAI